MEGVRYAIRRNICAIEEPNNKGYQNEGKVRGVVGCCERAECRCLFEKVASTAFA
jgi:hypothetical protein